MERERKRERDKQRGRQAERDRERNNERKVCTIFSVLGRLVGLSLFSNGAVSFTSMLLSEHIGTLVFC